MQEFVKVFDREEVVGKTGIITCSTIIMPQIFVEKTKKICEVGAEKIGYLVCEQQLHNDQVCYMVEYILVTNEGTTTNVVQNKVFTKMAKGYEAIEFHIHPKALGEQWYDKFSGGDYNTFRKILSGEDKWYKHVLFTPTHILTFGIQKPDFRIATLNKESLDAAMERMMHWHEQLIEHEIAY